MNWNLVAWVAGVLLTFAAIKFVFVVVHALFSKKTMKAAIDGIGVGLGESADRFSDYIKRKVDQRKAKKEEEKPVITIR